MQNIAAKKILLRDVQALTFYKGLYTKSSRTKSIPQLKCVGNSICKYSPSVVQCKNVGFDGNDVQWSCNANLDDRVKFDSLSVSCEGYSYSDDPYVLVGSCGLEYTLAYKDSTTRKRSSTSGPEVWIIPAVIIGFLLFGIYKCIKGTNRGYNEYHTVPDYQPPPPCKLLSNLIQDASAPPLYPNVHAYTSDSPGRNNFWGNFAGGATVGALGAMLMNRNNNHGFRHHYNSFEHEDTDDERRSRDYTTYEATGFGGTTRR
ncbi:DUF1183-domain-containing protein [Rozella allomycis CSF55]|uniref:Store-operated calcium entry-associated regulatory factor n=1 Tax=Rozella allomycis (strain CSF55) TaxID=988480 RepID=A0A075B4P6_ROZAC|nr:Protein of unknown function DUF1183, TMEM66 domain-containing protein [Rozella allomycis CSF55]RKP16809.1 DUF1183-domain-containing protein [Rozella allomycis CSF55]|eukprot:EPZ36359.1 Protein of unknown function DUF1183, TMEM66 domain-containing protein [Rozella allomycis CSF55]